MFFIRKVRMFYLLLLLLPLTYSICQPCSCIMTNSSLHCSPSISNSIYTIQSNLDCQSCLVSNSHSLHSITCNPGIGIGNPFNCNNNTSVGNTGVGDTSLLNTSLSNTSLSNTSLSNTSVLNTSVVNTSVVNTSVVNTSVVNTSVVNTSVVNTSVVNTSVVNTSLSNTSYTSSGASSSIDDTTIRNIIIIISVILFVLIVVSCILSTYDNQVTPILLRMTSTIRNIRLKQLTEQIKTIEQKLKEDEYDYNEHKKEQIQYKSEETEIKLPNIPEISEKSTISDIPDGEIEVIECN
jgi:hypothetical protein